MKQPCEISHQQKAHTGQLRQTNHFFLVGVRILHCKTLVLFHSNIFTHNLRQQSEGTFLRHVGYQP